MRIPGIKAISRLAIAGALLARAITPTSLPAQASPTQDTPQSGTWIGVAHDRMPTRFRFISKSAGARDQVRGALINGKEKSRSLPAAATPADT